MSRVQFVEYKGKRILIIDMSNCDLEEMVRVVKETKAAIAAEPPQSVLTLTNIRGVRYHGMVSKVAKDFTDYNKPFVKAGAVIGLDPARKSEFGDILNFSGRDIKIFDDADLAKEWLISQ